MTGGSLQTTFDLSVGKKLQLDSTLDVSGNNPGDGICATVSSDCTLRAALEESLALSGVTPYTELVLQATTYTVSSEINITAGSVLIKGAGVGATIISGGTTTNIFNLLGGSIDFTLDGVTLEDGAGSFKGGALNINGAKAVILRNCEIKNHTNNFQGGALYASSTDLTIGSCSITGNQTPGNFGGAISYSGGNGQLTIRNSTFSNNVGSFGGAIYVTAGSQDLLENNIFQSSNAGNKGGAIYATDKKQGFTLRNNIFDTNTAPTGGGVAMDDAGLGAIEGNLFLNNSASLGNGGGLVDTDIYANIFSGSSPENECYTDGASTLTSTGYNLAEDASCDFNGGLNDINGSADLEAGPPKDNGGPTNTILPNLTSPAVNAIPACTETLDQRELSRETTGICDIGSVELQ